MKQKADPRRWATSWLAGVTRAVANGDMPAAARRTAIERARTCGLTEDEIAAIVANAGSGETALPDKTASKLIVLMLCALHVDGLMCVAQRWLA